MYRWTSLNKYPFANSKLSLLRIANILRQSGKSTHVWAEVKKEMLEDLKKEAMNVSLEKT